MVRLASLCRLLDLADVTVTYTGLGGATIRADEIERVDVVAGSAALNTVLADLLTVRMDWLVLMAALEPEDQLAALPMTLVTEKPLTKPSKRIKKPIDLELLAQIIEGHCCGGDRIGGKSAGGRGAAHGAGSS